MTVNFDPEIFSLGPLSVRWYGLMYVIGFFNAGLIYKKLVGLGYFQVEKDDTDSLITYMLVGLMVGARLVYVVVYNGDYYIKNIGEAFAIWHGGLSYHGGVIGCAIAAYLFSKSRKVPLLQVCDASVLAGAQGVFFGRLGNFINGELYGRHTDVPWGMIFPKGGPYPRHPSQLYEGISEGVIIFALMWLLRTRVKYHGILAGIYIMSYGVARFCIEFVRQPDEQLGLYGGIFSMGQILCFIMILSGLALVAFSRGKAVKINVA